MISTQRIPMIGGTLRQRVANHAPLQSVLHAELECRTREDADAVAGVTPDPLLGRLGLVELLLNAIEHGNLAIDRELKCQLLRDQRFEEEVAARLAREPYRSRRVRVHVDVAYPVVQIEIHDEGAGFAWRSALTAEIEAAGCPNGRGIAMASRVCFPDLTYRDPGNVAVVTLAWPT